MAYGMQSYARGGFTDPVAASRKKLMEQLGYAAPAPAPSASPSARMPVGGGYGTATAASAAPAAPPAPPREVPGIIQARFPQYQQTQTNTAGGPSGPWAGVWNGITDPKDRDELQQYIDLLYSMPDFKGRHEQNIGLAALKANEIRNRKKDALGLDYHGTAKIGDTYNHLADQLMAQLSARGIGGSGIEAGATSRLRGLEGQAVGDYVSAQDEAARDRAERERLAEQQMLYQILMGNTQRNAQKQSEPGFWGDILGIGGSILGGIL